jgi:hypothetical protein
MIKHQCHKSGVNMAEYNACMEAFERLCEDVNADKKSAIDQSDYWLFELGFRSAIEELLAIADSGMQSKEFVSPRFQMLADKILQARYH